MELHPLEVTFPQSGCKVKIFYNEGVETLEQVAQRGGRCPMPGNIQSQVGRVSEQPDVIEDVIES